MPPSLEAIVVDDEPLARRDLCRLLAAMPQVEVVGQADDLPSAARLLDAADPDLAFLDVRLADGLAFSLFDRPRPGLSVIFVSAHEDYALRAFEVEAVDYLLKPVGVEALRRAVERATRSRTTSPPSRLGVDDTLFVKLDGTPTFLRVASIVAVSAEGDGSRVTFAGNTRRAAVSLGEWERRLPVQLFVRVHRSTLVNMHRVRRIEPWFNGRHRIYLDGIERPLTMSRRYARQLAERFPALG